MSINLLDDPNKVIRNEIFCHRFIPFACEKIYYFIIAL